jgi:DICT domain-containing protein
MVPESTLHQLKQALPGQQLPSSYGVYFKNTLVALCHALEDWVLHRGGDAGERPLILVAFQQGKWYLQEADRYFDLAACTRHIAIAAVPDSGFAHHKTGQLENVSLVELDSSDSLTQEWNLVILAPSYAAMVLCYELSAEDYAASGLPDVDAERKFYGLWTFDRGAVDAAAHISIERLRPYNPTLADRLDALRADMHVPTSAPPADLSAVVTRIVTYLQASQQELVATTRQTRELRGLEERASRLKRNLTANKLQAFLRMAQRVDARDRANPVAALQVAALSEVLGQMLDLPTLHLRRLRLAGLLLRIGLAAAPPEMFERSLEALDEASRSFWHDRARLSAQLLATMPELAPVNAIVQHHLERWDGSGRPDGLRGEAIAIESRILNLASYFQELTQSRGDRPALSLGEALAKCEQRSGERFDPALVDSLKSVVRLVEMGMMQLPHRPSQLPPVWLEDLPEPPPSPAPATTAP